MSRATYIPTDLPVPEDDGASDHLPGAAIPDVSLTATDGKQVDLATLPGRTVIFCYPRMAGPDESVPDDWNAIPGARGCTPESCAFRDLYSEFQSLEVGVFGISTQPTAAQAETHTRLHLPYPLLSDSELLLTSELLLPTFVWRDIVCLKRLTLVVQDGMIEHVFYPIFPPDAHPTEVLRWLREHDAVQD